jgi:DNA-binding NarL/FixJ family response regulator
MSSIVCIVDSSRIVREGLTRILAKSPFEPACTASSMEEVPSAIAGAGEQMLILIGVREECGLAKDLSAAKASFPGTWWSLVTLISENL